MPALALLTAAAFATATPVAAYETYKVTGIKAGESLIVRDEPTGADKPSDAKELRRIPADADGVLGTGRSVLIGDERWHEVSFKGTRGWVNGAFLEATAFADLKGATFQCSGTEPFWSVTLAPEGGTYSSLSDDKKVSLKAEQIAPATGRLFPLFYRLKGSDGGTYRVTVSRQEWCSDGMSDFDYGFQALLTDDGVFHEGCCVLKR